MSKKGKKLSRAKTNSNGTLTKPSIKKENLIVSFLKILFRWQTIFGIITLITFAYLIFDHIDHKSENEHLKDNIASKILEIRNSIHINNINTTNDTIGELKIIKDYQVAALEICNIYESIETSNTLKDNYKYKIMNINHIVQNYYDRVHHMGNLQIQIMKDVHSLMDIGKQYAIKEYDLIDRNKLFNVNFAFNNKQKVLEDKLEEFEKYAKNHDIDKCIEFVEDMYSNHISLMADDIFLLFVVDTNKILISRLQNINSNIQYYLDN